MVIVEVRAISSVKSKDLQQFHSYCNQYVDLGLSTLHDVAIVENVHREYLEEAVTSYL